MVTLISTLVLFQCQIKFLIFVFQIHWKMSLMDAFCAKFDWNCFSGSELGVLLAFLLLFYYLPLEKGVVLFYQNKRPVRLNVHLIIILFIDFCQFERAHIHAPRGPILMEIKILLLLLFTHQKVHHKITKKSTMSEESCIITPSHNNTHCVSWSCMCKRNIQITMLNRPEDVWSPRPFTAALAAANSDSEIDSNTSDWKRKKMS